jgi:hypothetical protein
MLDSRAHEGDSPLSDEGDDRDGPPQPPLTPRLVTVAPQKFSEYVLDPENADGKDYIFINLLGYRQRNLDDAAELAALYAAQAHEQMAEGAYRLGKRDKFGQRLTMEIDVGEFVLLPGWILRPDNVLALATPFVGFARRSRRK